MLAVLLMYQYNAQVVSSATDLQKITMNPSGEYVLNADFAVGKEHEAFDFRGLLDGRNHTIELYAPLFKAADNCYIRNLTVRAGASVMFANAITNSHLVLAQLENVYLKLAKLSNISQALISLEGTFIDQSENVTFLGCSLLQRSVGTSYSVISSSTNDSVASSFVSLHSSFALTAYYLSFGASFLYLENDVASDALSLVSQGPANQLSVVNTDVAIKNSFPTTAVAGLAELSDGAYLLNSSISLNLTNIQRCDGAFSTVESLFTWNCSLFLNITGANLSKLAGLAGSIGKNSMVTQSYVFLNVSAASQGDDLMVSGMIHFYAEFAKVLRCSVSVAAVLQSDRAFSFQGMVYQHNYSIQDSYVFGSLVVNYTATQIGQSNYNCKVAGAIMNSTSTVSNVYSNVNISFVAAKKNQKFFVAAGLISACTACEVRNSSVFGEISGEQKADGIYIAGFILDTNRLCTFQNIYVYPRVLGIAQPNDNGMVNVVGFVRELADVVAFDVQVSAEIMAVRNAAMVACYLFNNLELQSDIILQHITVRVFSKQYVDISLGVAAYGNLGSIFVDCSLENVNRQQAQCKTSEELKDQGIISLLSDKWELSSAENDGYPYCRNAFLLSNGKIILPGSSDINQSAYYFDEHSNMTFIKTDFDFCRGVCHGTAYSPGSFECFDAAANAWCIVSGQAQYLMGLSCVESDVQACLSGAKQCHRTAEVFIDGCRQTCDVQHGYCRSAVSNCDLGYIDTKCDQFNCAAQQHGCYDTAQCFYIEGKAYCGCTDQQYLFYSGECAVLKCPGLSSGVCTENGEVCFEEFAGQRCEKCRYSGFVVKSGECVKSQVSLIVAITIGAIVFLIVLAAAVVLFVKKYYLYLIKRGERYVKITNAGPGVPGVQEDRVMMI